MLVSQVDAAVLLLRLQFDLMRYNEAQSTTVRGDPRSKAPAEASPIGEPQLSTAHLQWSFLQPHPFSAQSTSTDCHTSDRTELCCCCCCMVCCTRDAVADADAGIDADLMSLI